MILVGLGRQGLLNLIGNQQFGFKLDQFISGRLKSPRKIILGRGEGSDITYVWIFNDISSKSFTGQEGEW